MKMTRDAEYDLGHEVEYSLLNQMSEGLSQRLTAMPFVFYYEREMPETMLVILMWKAKISHYDSLLPGSHTRNFKDFIGFQTSAVITWKTDRYRR